MERVVENTLSPEDTYEVLDVCLTDILEKAEAQITPEVDNLLVSFNRQLRIALGLPVYIPN